MEQARYWMWAKKKPDPNQRILTASSAAAMNSYGDSWEEQAFAEDAAGTLGGCVWPPRSYSCSFCRREFKSAQALGGHMNVHRRDRARLKQSSNSPSDVVVPQNHALNGCTTSSFDAVPNYSSQICTFLYNNPNPEFSDIGVRVSSPPPPPPIPTKVHYSDENISTLCFFSPLHVHKDDIKDDMVSLHPPSWSSFLSDKRDIRDFDSFKKKRPADDLQDSRAYEKEDCVTDDHLSMSLNLQRKASSDEEVASCKRRRIEAKPMLRCFPQSDVMKICSVAGTVDELDLELRLGNAPKVK